MKFDLAIYNRFKNGEEIVAELPATSPQLRKWISIFKPKAQPVDASVPENTYIVFLFELNKSLIDQYFGNDDILDPKRYYLNTEVEIFDLLEKLEIDPKLFTYPWKCDYPM